MTTLADQQRRWPNSSCVCPLSDWSTARIARFRVSICMIPPARACSRGFDLDVPAHAGSSCPHCADDGNRSYKTPMHVGDGVRLRAAAAARRWTHGRARSGTSPDITECRMRAAPRTQGESRYNQTAAALPVACARVHRSPGRVPAPRTTRMRARAAVARRDRRAAAPAPARGWRRRSAYALAERHIERSEQNVAKADLRRRICDGGSGQCTHSEQNKQNTL